MLKKLLTLSLLLLLCATAFTRECEFGYENCSCLGDDDYDDDWEGYRYYYQDWDGTEYAISVSPIDAMCFDEEGLFVGADNGAREVIEITVLTDDIVVIVTKWTPKYSIMDSFTSQSRLWPPDVIPHPHVPDEYKNPKPHPIIPPDMADVSKRSCNNSTKELFDSMVHSEKDYISDGLFDWQCSRGHWVKPGFDVCPKCGERRDGSSSSETQAPPSKHPAGQSNHPIKAP